MASKTQKRDIASFFKPYANSIPAKRPSPSLADEEVQYNKTTPKQPQNSAKRPSSSFQDDEIQFVATKPKQSNQQTPKSAARFKHVTSSPRWSPIGPGSGSSVKIPIRSPRPKPCQTPVTSFSSRLSAHYTASPLQKRKDSINSAQPSIPSFSFKDLSSSTQSIVRDGKIVAVKGSDEEDSDSLSSLDDILGRRKSDTVTSSSSPPELDANEREAERVRTIFRFTGGRSQPLVGRDKLRELYSKERDHKVDIGALMGDHFDDQEIEGNISKAKEGYEASRQDEERSRAQQDVGRNLLAAVVAGSSGEHDGISRLMNAVERTEALESGRSWSFFGPGRPKGSLVDPVEIATDTDLSDWWRETLVDDDSRSRSFLSGFMGEIWSTGRTPDEIIQWTFESIVQEPQHELRRSYVQAFQGAKPEWIRNYVSASKIEQVFLQIGATQHAVSCGDLIEPGEHMPGTNELPEYRYLLSVMEMLVNMAPHLGVPAYEKLLAILARLAIDSRVMSDARVSVAVEDSLSTLIELSFQEADLAMIKSFVADLATNLIDPTLRAQLLRHILCISPVAARIRIKLAHLFLSGPRSDLDADLDLWSIDITTLTCHLDSDLFNTTIRSSTERPDYANMTASTYLLDIAIADGGRPTPFASRAEEVAFNRQVDRLADRIKAIFASIADTGASHMRRTEAKEALQALHYRLLYAVRTEPRPKKSVFGGRDGEEYRAEERSKGFMTKFLSRKKEKN